MTVPEHRLTKKGQATRDRIVQVAAELVLQNGVAATTHDQVRKAAGISGSQLMHYFPDKAALVSAVVEWRAHAVRTFTEMAANGRLDTFDGLRAWVDAYLSREEMCVAGCSFGSLAGEILKTDPQLRGHLADGFDQWEELFRAGFRAMQDRGELSTKATPESLANVLMAAFQGGMLLAQAKGDSAPLRDALSAALDYLASFRETRTPVSA